MKQIAIVAAGPSFLDAPYHRPGWQIWATGWRIAHAVPRVDRFYEVHDRADDIYPPHYLDALEFLPVWNLDPAFNGNLVREVEIKNAFGTEFLTCSAAWMCAEALLESPDRIGFWGVEMDWEGEYRNERYGVKHFIRLATERGIDIVYPPDNPLAVDQAAYPHRHKKEALQ